jgi:hypothetical protein
VSIFAPFDPRGPDQRRKQLIAKLAGQAGAAQQAGSRTPMPGHFGGATLAEGRSFRGASSSRIGGQAHVTQQPNILASVLARLGVSGRSHSEEMSPGRGLPIAPPVPNVGLPIPAQGAAIPTPAQIPAVSPVGGVPVASASTDPTQSPPLTAATATNPDAVATNVSDSGLLTHSDGQGGSYGPILEHGAGTTVVDLGNGMYYDPVSGQVIGQQDVNPSLPGTRAGVKTGF